MLKSRNLSKEQIIFPHPVKQAKFERLKIYKTLVHKKDALNSKWLGCENGGKQDGKACFN